MKTASLTTALTFGLILSASVAQSRAVTLDLTMSNYAGRPAFVVAYVVDAKGKYLSTVFAAGSNARYFEHLDRWFRMFSRAHTGVDGMTGASIGAGQSSQVTVDVADSLFNAGNTLRIETAVENQYYVPDEAAMALDDANSGASVAGKTYVASAVLTY